MSFLITLKRASSKPFLELRRFDTCFMELVIQVREELINMLKNKETEQSRELAALQQDLEHRMKIVDDVRLTLFLFNF